MQNEYILVSCAFEHDLRDRNTHRVQSTQLKTYTYITQNRNVCVGDYVTVKSPTTGLTCVKVVGIEKRMLTFKEANAFKWVYFHLTAGQVELADQAIEQWRKNAQEEQVLEAELEKAVKEAVRGMQIQELAKNSPQVAEAYAKLQRARGNPMSAEASSLDPEAQKSGVLGLFFGL